MFMLHEGDVQIRWLSVNALLEKEREKREHAPILPHRYLHTCIHQPGYVVTLLALSPLTQFHAVNALRWLGLTVSGNKSETSAFTAFHHFLPCLKHMRIVLTFVSMNYGYRQSRNNHLVFSQFVMRGSSSIIQSITLVLWGIWLAAGYIVLY